MSFRCGGWIDAFRSVQKTEEIYLYMRKWRSEM